MDRYLEEIKNQIRLLLEANQLIAIRITVLKNEQVRVEKLLKEIKL